MSYLVKKHWSFLGEIFTSSKLDSNTYTIFPSVLFLGGTFVLLYLQFHQFATYTRWGARIYKDVIFHWAYFYISRIWFVFVKFSRFVTTTIDEYIEATSPKEEIHINQTLLHACIFMMVLTVSVVPLTMLAVQQMYRRQIPNFLMWVADDPWLGSEIGTSGHYLERPFQFTRTHQNRRSARRSKRSASADNDIASVREPENVRSCKSMIAVNVVKSIDDLSE